MAQPNGCEGVVIIAAKRGVKGLFSKAFRAFRSFRPQRKPDLQAVPPGPGGDVQDLFLTGETALPKDFPAESRQGRAVKRDDPARGQSRGR